VAAPGQSVWTADNTGTNLTSLWMNRGWAGATSEAAAHVAGVAALLISRQPNMTNQVVKDLIEENTDDVNATGWDEATGRGIVNASKALQPLLPTGTPTCRYILPRNYADGGQRATLTGDVNFTAYAFSYSNSTSSVQIYVDGSLSGGLTYYNPNIVTDEYYMGNTTYYRVISTSSLSDGTHSFELKCSESDGDYRWTNRTYDIDN
jgi:subtilisin family serine protease